MFNKNAVRGLAVALLAMLVAACQSAGPEDMLGLDPNTPVPEQEITGTGPVSVTLLVPRTASQPAAVLARDMHDGAALAATELGGGAMRLVTIDTRRQAGLAKSRAEQATASGTKLLLAGLGSASGLASIEASKRPPVIDLSSAGGGGNGIYAFASDDIASALEGVRAAVAAKQPRVVVAVPESMAAQDIDRIRRGVGAVGGTLTDVVAYPAAEGAIAAALAQKRAAFEKATTLVVFGSGLTPVTVANAVASGGFGNNITTLVGNSGWSRDLFSAPVLDGALIAVIDQQSLKELGDRYSAATGRPLSLEAAFAYDAVALAAGLIPSAGADAISAKVLNSKAGFRGTTGIFRFDAQGNVERRHALYQIDGGQIKRLSGPGEGF